jgi:hypothetical protein
VTAAGLPVANEKGRPTEGTAEVTSWGLGLSDGQRRGWFRANFAIWPLTGLGLFVNGTYSQTDAPLMKNLRLYSIA